jgi:hypothetical protein
VLDGLSPGAGAVSTGFWVSVGWPVTSPGREDMPGSLDVPWSPVVPGAAGREMLPELPWSLELPVALPLVVPELVEPVLDPTEPLVPELVPSEPLLLEPVSVPDVVELVEPGAAGVVGLVLLSSAGGVSDGEVRVWCIELVSLELRPWPCLCFLWCFFEVLVAVSSLLLDEVEPLTAESSLSVALLVDELSLPMPVLVELEPVDGFALDESSLLDELLSDGKVVFDVDVSELGVELLEGLLLGRLLLLLAVFPELPGSALLF